LKKEAEIFIPGASRALRNALELEVLMNDGAAPRHPYGPSPLRKPGSIRRTSSIDTDWPEGQGNPMHMQGHARDLITQPDGSELIVAEDQVDVIATPMREIVQISTPATRADLSPLIGKRAGGHLRAAISQALPEERAAGTPLYLLLDDLAGASLVAGWAWSRWVEDWMARLKQSGAQSTAGKRGNMEGICIGFAPGSSALMEDGTSRPHQSSCPVPPLVNPADPHGWHALNEQQGVGMRRARRIDVWRENGVILIDSGFQDSSTAPEGGRVAIHEYHLTATVDCETMILADVRADARILPYRECPGAVGNVGRMVGQPLAGLRLAVLEILMGTAGCTHLNDALRALAEVPQMVLALDRA
jgi:hypothetical protein